MSRLIHLTLLAVLLATLGHALPAPDEEASPVVAEVEDASAEVTSTIAPDTFSSSATEAAPPMGFGNVITNGVSHLNSSVYNEPPCLRNGGACLPEIECPVDNRSAERGLCPSQQNLGVECCHGISLLETRCRNRGGECTGANSCARALVEDRAEDCPEDKVCCVLVNL